MHLFTTSENDTVPEETDTISALRDQYANVKNEIQVTEKLYKLFVNIGSKLGRKLQAKPLDHLIMCLTSVDVNTNPGISLRIYGRANHNHQNSCKNT